MNEASARLLDTLETFAASAASVAQSFERIASAVEVAAAAHVRIAEILDATGAHVTVHQAESWEVHT